MTREEFFKEVIMSVEGIPVPEKNKVIFCKKTDAGVVWCADLEINGKISFLWCNWDEFYLPMINNFEMSEDEVTKFIGEQLEVDLVGYMPSLRRLDFMGLLHSEENKITD